MKPPARGGGDDVFTWVIVVMVFGGTVLAFAVRLWSQAVDWLLAHHLVVSSVQDPIVTLPRADGAGVDWPRLIIAVAVLVFVAFLGALAGRRRFANREVY